MWNVFITRSLTGLILAILFFIVIFYAPPIVFSLIIGAILAYILIHEWPLLFSNDPLNAWIIAPLYPIAPALVLIALNQQYHSLIFPLFALTASFDTGAYVIGSIIGTHKVAPTISSGKTWEGLIGGYICLVWTLYALTLLKKSIMPIGHLIVLCLIISALACAGDLFESLLKRRAKIKDTCSILPGHGGFLDRLDSVFFVAIFFYFCRNYLTGIL